MNEYEEDLFELKYLEEISELFNELKEINNSKNGESNAKAQQYLDGLLKIPFGVNKEEQITTFLNTFKEELLNFINIFTCKLSELDEEEYDYSQIEGGEYILDTLKQYICLYHELIDNSSENSYNLFINNETKTLM